MKILKQYGLENNKTYIYLLIEFNIKHMIYILHAWCVMRSYPLGSSGGGGGSLEEGGSGSGGAFEVGVTGSGGSDGGQECVAESGERLHLGGGEGVVVGVLCMLWILHRWSVEDRIGAAVELYDAVAAVLLAVAIAAGTGRRRRTAISHFWFLVAYFSGNRASFKGRMSNASVAFLSIYVNIN